MNEFFRIVHFIWAARECVVWVRFHAEYEFRMEFRQCLTIVLRIHTPLGMLPRPVLGEQRGGAAKIPSGIRTWHENDPNHTFSGGVYDLSLPIPLNKLLSHGQAIFKFYLQLSLMFILIRCITLHPFIAIIHILFSNVVRWWTVLELILTTGAIRNLDTSQKGSKNSETKPEAFGIACSSDDWLENQRAYWTQEDTQKV